MAPRRTRAAGHAAAACGAAMWLFSTSTFVSSGGVRTTALRGSQGSTADAYQPFSSQQKAIEAEQSINWRSLTGIAAGLGLAAAVMTTPAFAQDEVVEGERLADPAAPARQRKRAARPKVKKEEKAAEQEFKLPSFSVPDEAPVKQKVIISPADELDDDEKPLGAANWPLAALIFFGPSAIYTTFWVLGSLDII
eukprot:CAMPEP_0171181016 /NCGR_PEP_ID=MMETSP0790-20130122/14048_1 /TAXON_ID=2925 /ORGANISM="Alexandrium catenella, Strain OF101" /LENGTH=193 /DNA_ID=CAMNT_0011645953 /DNA_START=59 /DNA_END=640 /DNA_ORIENTATION=+